jgi:hypothetical protein
MLCHLQVSKQAAANGRYHSQQQLALSFLPHFCHILTNDAKPNSESQNGQKEERRRMGDLH